MISKMTSIRLSLTVAAGLAAAVSSHAQSVTATISGVASGSSFNYTITLHNTGSVALNSFWYGWTTGGDDLASAPSKPANSLGWANTLSGNSIKWVNSSGTALAAGASTTFTFVSSSSPSAITMSPSGESVAYTAGIDFTEGVPGDSSPVFSPMLVSGSSTEVAATATISGIAAGNLFDYTVTLQNTGTKALNSFWYGWTIIGDNLPTDPSDAGNSLGWVNQLSANSIMWINSSGTELAPGDSATFTFVSSSSPAAITTSPSGESVAYAGGIDCSQGLAGDSTTAFSPTLVSGTSLPPVLALTFTPAGSGAVTPNSIILAWPATNGGFTLQSTTNLVAPMVWATVTVTPAVVKGQNVVTNIISGTQQFFRLASP
jgi:hypothetical protein